MGMPEGISGRGSPSGSPPSGPKLEIGRPSDPTGQPSDESLVGDALSAGGAARPEGRVGERGRERAEQPVVGQRGGAVEGEPGDLLALARGRSRILDAAVEKKAEVEVEMAVRRRVDVGVQEPQRTGRGLHRKAGLLDGLPAGGDLRRLPGVDVSAGLQPTPEAAVAVEEDPAGPDHDGRGGHVGRVRRPIEGRDQPGNLGSDPLDRRRLLSVDRPVAGEEPRDELARRAGRERRSRLGRQGVVGGPWIAHEVRR